MLRRLRSNRLRGPLRTGALMALFLILITFAAQSASAQNVLFIGKYENLRPLPYVIDSIPPSSAQPLVTTPGATTGQVNGFTLPTKAFSQAFSFTATFPGYPFLFGSADRYQKQAVFAASYNTPSGISTFNPTNVLYPYATLTPPPGFVRQNFGPNGFGGAMTIVKRTAYTGLFAAGIGGNYEFSIPFTLTYGGCRFCLDLAGFSIAEHTFATTGGTAMSPITNIKLFKAWGGPAMTGVITLSNPAPNAATYTVFTGMDNRNAAGTSGTIQLISPRLLFGYGIEGPIPPPGDGTGTVTNIQTGVVGTLRTTIQVPEPAQLALITVGAFGLVGLVRRRRS